MKLVYIAGPYRAVTPWEVELNVRNAETVALAVAKLGFVPVCPHAMYRHFDKQLSDEFWLDGTLELLRRCDGAVFIPGWQRSSGSQVEYVEAHEKSLVTASATHGTSVVQFCDALPTLLNGWPR